MKTNVRTEEIGRNSIASIVGNDELDRFLEMFNINEAELNGYNNVVNYFRRIDRNAEYGIFHEVLMPSRNDFSTYNKVVENLNNFCNRILY